MYDHVEKRLQEKGVSAGLPHPEHFDDGLPEMLAEAQALTRQYEQQQGIELKII